MIQLLSRKLLIILHPHSESEIGRKLSHLCGGPFFQRLFTRFTTPEEIFGPLSLRALENDEYVRNIEGYLPTATVGEFPFHIHFYFAIVRIHSSMTFRASIP